MLRQKTIFIFEVRAAVLRSEHVRMSAKHLLMH